MVDRGAIYHMDHARFLLVFHPPKKRSPWKDQQLCRQFNSPKFATLLNPPTIGSCWFWKAPFFQVPTWISWNKSYDLQNVSQADHWIVLDWKGCGRTAPLKKEKTSGRISMWHHFLVLFSALGGMAAMSGLHPDYVNDQIHPNSSRFNIRGH